MPYLFLYPATGAPALVANYKWTNDFTYSSGSGPGNPINVITADLGGVNFEQANAALQPVDGGGFADFDGSNDVMLSTVTDTQILDTEGVAGECTLMVKVQSNSNNTFEFICGSSEGGNPERFYILRNSSGSPDVWGFGAFDIFPTTALASNSATLTLVIDNGTMYGYVDGVQAVTGAITQTAGTGNVIKIGTAGGASTYYDGGIDDFRIFTKALSPAEVLTVYNDMNPLTADYKWTNDYTYSSGSGPGNPISVIGADLGGVNFEQATVADQAIDGGSTADFDGSSDNYTPVTPISFDAGDFTLAFKVKIANYGTTLIGAEDAGNTLFRPETITTFILRTATATIRTFNTQSYSSAAYITIFLVRESDVYSLYLDTTKSVDTHADSGALLITRLGMKSGAFPSFFDGDLDDFRIFTKALSAAEVTAVYNDMNP